MDRIARDRAKVVCPVIDIISDDTLEFSFNNDHVSVGGFDWGLQVCLSASQKRERGIEQMAPE